MSSPISYLEHASEPVLLNNAHVTSQNSISDQPTDPLKDIFLPDDAPDDKFISDLIRQSFLDENGIAKKEFEDIQYPDLDFVEIESIFKWIAQDLIISNNKDGKDFWEKAVKLETIYEDLYLELSKTLEIKYFEIFGSLVPHILRIAYLQKAFKSIGVKNVETLITPELCSDITPEPNDFDTRFKASKKDKKVNLYGFQDSAIKVISSHVHQDEKTVRSEALDKCETILKKNKYSIVSTGDHKTKTCEFQLFTELQRKNLFYRDAFRIKFHFLKKYIKLVCDKKNRWQVPVDLLGNIIDDNDPATINKYGWINVLSLITRGKKCRNPIFLKTLYENFKNELIEEEIQVKSKDVLASKIETLFFKCAFAHHRNDPFGTLCFALNTVYFLLEEDPELGKNVLQKILVNNQFPCFESDTDVLSKNPSLKILWTIYSILKKNASAAEILFSLLQIQSFIGLTFTQCNYQENVPKFVVRKHCFRPAAETQFFSGKTKYSILLPIRPDNAYNFVLEKMQNQPEIFGLLEQLICCTYPEQYGSASSPSPIQKYRAHLNVNLKALIDQVLSNAFQPNGRLSSLNYSLLNACYRIQHNPILLQQILQLMPIAVSRTEFVVLQTKWCQDLAQNVQESEWPVTIAAPIAEMIEDQITAPLLLYKKWLQIIGKIPKQINLARQFLTTYKLFLSEEEYWKLHSYFLEAIIAINPGMAFGLLKALHQKHDAQVNVNSWKIFLGIFNSFQNTQPNELLSYLPALAELAVKWMHFSDITKEVFFDKKLKVNFHSFLKELSSHAIPEITEILSHGPQSIGTSLEDIERLWESFCDATLAKDGPNAALSMWNLGVDRGFLLENSCPMRKKKCYGNIICKVIHEPGVAEETISQLFFDSLIHLQGFRKIGEIAKVYLGTKLSVINLLDLKVHLTTLSNILTLEELFEVKREILIKEIGQIDWSNILDRWEELLRSKAAFSSVQKTIALSNGVVTNLVKAKFREKDAFLRALCRVSNILLSDLCDKILCEDASIYYELLKQITLSIIKLAIKENEQILNELLLKVLSLVPKFDSIHQRSIVIFIVNILERLTPKEFTISGSIHSILQKHQIAWMELNSTSSILRFIRVYQLHKQPIVVTNACLETLSIYLSSSQLSQDEIFEIYSLQYHLLDLVQGNLAYPVMIRYQIALIGALLKNSDKSFGNGVIKAFLGLYNAQSGTDENEFSGNLIQWARSLRKYKFQYSLDLLKILEERDAMFPIEIGLELLGYLENANVDEARAILSENCAILSKEELLSLSSKHVKKLIQDITSHKINHKDLQLLLDLLDKYSIEDEDYWHKILSKCADSNNPAIFQNAWNLIDSRIFENSITFENGEFYCKCWLYGIRMLQILDPEKFSKYFYQCVIIHGFIENMKARIEFYDQLTRFTISLHDHPEQIDFLKFLRLHFFTLMAENQKAKTSLLGVMILTKHEVVSDDLDEYSRGLMTVDGIFDEIRSHIPNEEACQILQLLVKNSVKFPLVPELISILGKSKRLSKFSIVPLLSYISSHHDPELNLIVARMINGWLSEKKRLLINEEQKTGLITFLSTILGEKDPNSEFSMQSMFNQQYSTQILDEISEMFSHRDFEKIIGTTNLRQILVYITYGTNVQRVSCEESKTIEFHKAILSFFSETFPFVVRCQNPHYEKNYFETFLNYAITSVNLFDSDELLRYLLFEIADSGFQNNRFNLSRKRILLYLTTMIEELFNVEKHTLKAGDPPLNLSINTRKDLSDAVKCLIQIIIKNFPSNYDETFSTLTVYILYKVTFHKSSYDYHLKNCEEIFKQHLDFIVAFASNYPKRKNEISGKRVLAALFVCHMFIPIDEESKVNNLSILLRDGLEECMNEIDFFFTKCNHPVPLWYMIKHMSSVSKIPSDKKERFLLTIYDKIFAAIKPFMDEEKPDKLFEWDGVPIYAHFMENFLKEEILINNPLALEILEEWMKQVLLLHSSFDKLPGNIGKKYDPADYLVNTLFIAFRGGCFKDHYKEYLELLNLLVFMKEGAQKKYATFIVNMMLKVPNGKVLTADENGLRDSLLEHWKNIGIA